MPLGRLVGVPFSRNLMRAISIAKDRGKVRSASPRQWRVVALAGVIVIGAIGVVLYSAADRARSQVGAAGGATPARTSPTAVPLSAEIRARLAGRWLRPDGGYVMTISDIGDDGKVAATYENPRPINIARAEAGMKDGKVSLYIELRDRGYPGNYYVLDFDDAQDQLVGVYYHLGIQQQFDVHFERLK
jgi:hypothetical protein